MRALFPLVVLLAACTGPKSPWDDEVGGDDGTVEDSGAGTTDSGEIPCTDADGDGVCVEDDCDDTDAAVNPDAAEVCDGIDNDCDGLTDDADDSVDLSTGGTWYTDGDADGYGDGAVTACSQPDGTAEVDGDCDDADAAYNPGADESDCTDPNDYNCDDSVGYADDDADGWAACEECDDGDAAVNPDATEVCNDLDDDCDGLVDDEDDGLDNSTGSAWYADTDEDGFGDADTEAWACDAPEGTVADATDCDDGAASVNPDATEVCNDLDDDCDALVDDDDDSLDTTTASTWYADGDGDGFGDADDSALACDTPSGSVADSTDCDDGDSAVNPDATEVCNEVDDDCDGLVDDDDDSLDTTTASTWYTDSDGDGYGDDDDSTLACDAPSGTVADGGDCDDDESDVSPGASEYCNDLDDDCDGLIDDEDDDTPLDVSTWYTDDDCDGFGDSTAAVSACEQPEGTVTDDTDCDDTDALFNTDALEICNSADNDCDGTADDDCQEPIEIGSPSADPVDSPSAEGACALIGEMSAVANTHDIDNMDTFMATLVGDSSGLTESTTETADVLDYSARCSSDYGASVGNYTDTTTDWPTLSSTGSAGAARFRGYLHVGCDDPLAYTLGLIGNDALDLTIEGTEIAWVNWNDGQWKKFRYVVFPEPGLYAFEVRWSTNLICEIDPFELVWAEGFVEDYDGYDDMCASSTCEYGDGEEIPGFEIITSTHLLQSTDGSATDCLQCDSDSDCGSSESCNSAGICEGS